MRLALLLAAPLAVMTLAAADSVGFTAPPGQIDETAGSVDLVVTRVGSGAGAASVDVTAGGGSAILGTDYQAPAPASLSWVDGDLSPRIVTVPILHDPGYRNLRWFRIGLANPVGLAIDPGTGHVDLTVVEHDPDPAGYVSVIAPGPDAGQTVADDAGSVVVQVARVGGGSGAVTATFGCVDLTALADTDYTVPASLDVTWSDGETGVKTLAVPLIPRLQPAGPRLFSIGLQSIAGGAAMTSSTGVNVTILDHLPCTAGTLAAPSVLIAREGDPASLTIARLGGRSGAVSVDYTLGWGTAVADVNYQPTAGTLHWADGDDAPQTIAIPILSDGVATPTLSAWIAYTNPTGGLVIPPYAGTSVTIVDGEDGAGVVGFSTDVLYVPAAAGQAVLAVTRTGGSQGAISVAWTASDGSATAGVDYLAANGTLDWPDGDAAPRLITIPVLAAGRPGEVRAFYLDLSDPAGGAALDDQYGWRSEVAVGIVNPSQAGGGSIAWSASAVTVHESAGQVVLQAVRSGSSAGQVVVPVTALDQSARLGPDYLPAAPATLVWADGESGAKGVAIPIVHDGLPGGTRAFRVHLGPASGGAAVASPTAATVTIVDDDPAPAGRIAFAASARRVAADAGTTTIQIVRSGGTAGAVSVGWATTFAAPATARPGVDAVAACGRVAWNDGEGGAKSIAVGILDDGMPGGDRTVILQLAEPLGGAVLDRATGADAMTLTIAETMAPPAGTIACRSAAQLADRTAAESLVWVERRGGTSGVVSVAYLTWPDGAVEGRDYLPAFGWLRWADGEGGAKAIHLPVLPGTIGGGLGIGVGIATPTGGALLGASSTEVTIGDPGDTPAAGGGGGCGSGATGVLIGLGCALAGLRRRR